MYSTHKTLEHIANITSHRDMDMLALSLLKSVNLHVNATSSKIIRFDNKDQPLQQSSLNEKQEFKINYENIVIENPIMKLIERNTVTEGREAITKLGDSILTIFLILSERRSTNYLVIKSKKHLRKEGRLMIQAILDIYRNFKKLLLDSQTDELTGLANRKTFDAAVDRVFETSFPVKT